VTYLPSGSPIYHSLGQSHRSHLPMCLPNETSHLTPPTFGARSWRLPLHCHVPTNMGTPHPPMHEDLLCHHSWSTPQEWQQRRRHRRRWRLPHHPRSTNMRNVVPQATAFAHIYSWEHLQCDGGNNWQRGWLRHQFALLGHGVKKLTDLMPRVPW
jgi:hypothetical protein